MKLYQKICLILLLFALAFTFGCYKKNPVAPSTLLTGMIASAGQNSGPLPVTLGTAVNYAILVKTAITATVPVSITGNVGIYPGLSTSIVGFVLSTNGTGGVYSIDIDTTRYISGNVYANDYKSPTPANLSTAVNAMATAYADAASRVSANNYTSYTSIGSGSQISSFAPGLYKWGSYLTINGNITLNGTASDVWIFQISGYLQVNAIVTLTGGALAQNVFWQVGSYCSINVNKHLEGIVLTGTSTGYITLDNGASVHGRLYSQDPTGVTLNLNSSVTTP